MTTTEHLNRIAAKCREISLWPPVAPTMKALALSTIAAISCHETMDGGAAKHFLAEDIIAAWPEELLK